MKDLQTSTCKYKLLVNDQATKKKEYNNSQEIILTSDTLKTKKERSYKNFKKKVYGNIQCKRYNEENQSRQYKQYGIIGNVKTCKVFVLNRDLVEQKTFWKSKSDKEFLCDYLELKSQNSAKQVNAKYQIKGKLHMTKNNYRYSQLSSSEDQSWKNNYLLQNQSIQHPDSQFRNQNTSICEKLTQDSSSKYNPNKIKQCQDMQKTYKIIKIELPHKEETFLNNNTNVHNIQFQAPSHLSCLQDFLILKQLGRGKFGVVKMVKHRLTGFIFSLKIINKKTIFEQNMHEKLVNQIKIQMFLKHCHIIKLYDIFFDQQNIYLLMELAIQGNLLNFVKGRTLKESQCRKVMKDICIGVQQLHNNYIMHRDLKPENIVICFGMPKICDFGVATYWKKQCPLRDTFCGSPLYICPQMLKSETYSFKADLWSLGIICYELLTGKNPFQIQSEEQIVKIITQNIQYPNWLSEGSIIVLKSLLNKDQKKRKSLSEIFNNWFDEQV